MPDKVTLLFSKEAKKNHKAPFYDMAFVLDPDSGKIRPVDFTYFLRTHEAPELGEQDTNSTLVSPEADSDIVWEGEGKDVNLYSMSLS